MKELPSGSVDLILTDLPYGVLNKSRKHAQECDSPICLSCLWKEYERILKPNGVCLLFASGIFTAQLMLSNPKMWRYNLVWDKVNPTGFLNAKKMPMRSHEDICVFYRQKGTYNPQMSLGEPLHSQGKTKGERTCNTYGSFRESGDQRKGCVWKYPKSVLSFKKLHPSQTLHPSEKSGELLEYLIQTYSNEGDTVLDSCMGSGSTGVACANTGRTFWGIEKDERYFKLAKGRMEK